MKVNAGNIKKFLSKNNKSSLHSHPVIIPCHFASNVSDLLNMIKYRSQTAEHVKS